MVFDSVTVILQYVDAILCHMVPWRLEIGVMLSRQHTTTSFLMTFFQTNLVASSPCHAAMERHNRLQQSQHLIFFDVTIEQID